MGKRRRLQRVNSLLKEVISEVIHKQVKNPHLPPLLTITDVVVTKDLRHAKVYVSVIGSDQVKNDAITVLQSASGFIAVQSSKQVVMRFFPEITFYLDNSVEKQIRMEGLISELQAERKERENDEDSD